MSERQRPRGGTLCLGDFHPHLERALAARVRELAPGGDARGLLVVTPNRYLAVHLRRRAAELGAPTLGLRVRALEDLAGELAAPALEGLGLKPVAGWEAPFAAEVLGPRLRLPILAEVSYFGELGGMAGLFRALAGTFRDLRDALVDPPRLKEAARAALPASLKLRELTELYRLYCEALSQRGLADARRVGELAARAVERQPALLPAVLLVYGFYDLVGRQRSLLEALAAGRICDAFFPRAGEGAAWDYARPLEAWLESLGLEPRPLFAQREAEAPPGKGAGPGDLGRLRAGLFREKRGGAGAGDGSVRLLSAPEPAREAREVLRLLLTDPGVSSGVLLRRGEAALPQYLAGARGRQVALHLPAGEPWRRIPAGRLALALVELARERRGEGDGGEGSLPRAQVEDLLGNPALSPELFEEGSYPGRWPQLLRRMGVVAGVAAWQRLAERHAGDGEAGQADVQGAGDAGREGSGEGVIRPADAPGGAGPAAEIPAAAGPGAGEPAAGTAAGAATDRGDAAEEEDEDQERNPHLRRELPPLARFAARLLADTAELAADPPSWRDFHRRLARLLTGWIAAGAERDELLAALAPLAALDGVLTPSWGTAREVVGHLLDRGRRLGGRFGDAPSVGDLMSFRGVTFDRVVLPGLVERTFPRRPRQDPILLDEERAALNRHLGQGSEPRELPEKVRRAASEEKLLLRLAAGSARRELILTWPRGGDDGRPQVPSTYLLEVAAVLAGREVDFGVLEAPEPPLALATVPLSPAYPEEAEAPVMAASELDLRWIDRALAPGPETDRELDQGELSYLLTAYPRFAASLAADRARFGFATRNRLTPYDGLVEERLARAWFEARAAATGAPRLSASALEGYARCSFHFFHRNVLGLESEPPPERTLDQDPRRLGALYHRLLRDLFAALGEAGLLPLTPEGLPRARRLIRPTLEALLAARPLWLQEGPPALWEARRRRLVEDVDRLLELEADEGARGWQPATLERGFGLVGEEPPVLEFGGARLALAGRIDRLDRGPAGLRVLDYKTGRLKPSEHRPGDLRGGQRIQLALYHRAVPRLDDVPGAGELPVEGAYVGVTAASGHARYLWRQEDFEATREELNRLVAAMLEGMARGELYQVERGRFCDAYCPYGPVCGPQRSRLIESKAEDPRVAGSWRRKGAEA